MKAQPNTNCFVRSQEEENEEVWRTTHIAVSIAYSNLRMHVSFIPFQPIEVGDRYVYPHPSLLLIHGEIRFLEHCVMVMDQ